MYYYGGTTVADRGAWVLHGVRRVWHSNCGDVSRNADSHGGSDKPGTSPTISMYLYLIRRCGGRFKIFTKIGQNECADDLKGFTPSCETDNAR